MDRLVTRLEHPFALHEIACRRVGDRQRVALPAVAEREVAFEVGAPNVVGLHGMSKRLGARRHPKTGASRTHEPVSTQDVADGAGRRHD